MPIYEFYCESCHTIFNFFSRGVDTRSRPKCPKCSRKLKREVSAFAMTGRHGESDPLDDLPIDEAKMERAIAALAGEAEQLNEEDPRQAAKLMRKFSDMTGVEFGKSMEEAIGRMEAGEDPEKVEAEMGDLIEGEEPFILQGGKLVSKSQKKSRGAPKRDETLYDM